MWNEVNFGKWKGKKKTLPQIIFLDPDWFFWAIEKGAFKNYPQLALEAARLNQRARCVKIPSRYGTDKRVEYAIHPSVGKFTDIEIVEKTRPSHQGSTPTWREDVIDMSVSRSIADYDKTGGKILTDSLKFILFRSENARLTKKLCGDFFDDDANFDLPPPQKPAGRLF